ncbi:MAG: hypothetical protein HQK96_16765 [Nitrospirae bacterium]|nr:hypothetical protein [Nitrospirota bacterium]
MRILVHLRVGIGDAVVWMPKFKGLFQFHGEDEIYFVVNSRPDFQLILKIFLLNPDFAAYFEKYPERVVRIPYHSPVDFGRVRCLVPPCDMFFDFDVYSEGQWTLPVDMVYPFLGYDMYPVEMIKNRTGDVLIHPYGFYIRDTWTVEKWEELADRFVRAGFPVKFLGDYKNSIYPIDDLIGIVRNARLWIGIDTGTRNLAMVHGVPVIELGTPGKGFPNHDIFHPKQYRMNSKYHEDIDKVTPVQIFNEGMKWLIAPLV